MSLGSERAAWTVQFAYTVTKGDKCPNVHIPWAVDKVIGESSFGRPQTLLIAGSAVTDEGIRFSKKNEDVAFSKFVLSLVRSG